MLSVTSADICLNSHPGVNKVMENVCGFCGTCGSVSRVGKFKNEKANRTDKQNGMIKIHGGSNWIHFANAAHPWPSIIETSGMHHTNTIQQYTTQK